MSENEQKAGCVDLPELPRPAMCDVTVADSIGTYKFYTPNQMHAYARAALEAAALSPARSGEAVVLTDESVEAMAVRAGLVWMSRHDKPQRVSCNADHDRLMAFARILLREIAPRNESSGVSPGGGELAQMIGEMENFAAVADHCAITEGNAPAVIRVWADRLRKLTTPAPAAGADGAVVLDRGFKYENGIHTPTVLVGFAPSDFAARDKFAAALSDGAGQSAGNGEAIGS